MLSYGLLAGWLLAAPTSGAVPAGAQAVMFSKIVAYDKALSERKLEQITVGVVYDTNLAEAEELSQAFRAAGFKAAALRLDAVRQHIERIDLLYIFSGEMAAKLEPTVHGTGVLCVSGDAELAESGAVSVALGLDPDGRPRIFVHLRRLKQDGHALSASLLALARIIR